MLDRPDEDTGSVGVSVFNGRKDQTCSISAIALQITLSSKTCHVTQPQGDREPGGCQLADDGAEGRDDPDQ